MLLATQIVEAERICYNEPFKTMKVNSSHLYRCSLNGRISKSTVSQVLNGTRERIAFKTIYEMVCTMGVSLKEFVDDPIFDYISD